MDISLFLGIIFLVLAAIQVMRWMSKNARRAIGGLVMLLPLVDSISSGVRAVLRLV